jgi:hypothetical protein
MRIPFRYSLRTLLVVVTVLALMLGLGRYWYEQNLMSRAVDDVLENSTVERVRTPNTIEPWKVVDSAVFSQHAILEQNFQVTVDVFLAIATENTTYTDYSLKREMHALHAINVLFKRSASWSNRRYCVDRLAEILLTKPLPGKVESELIRLIRYWVGSAGINLAQRHQLVEMAKSRRIFDWAHLLVATGDREGIKLALNCDHNLHKTFYPKVVEVINNVTLLRTRWHGCLPYAETWLKNQYFVEESGLLKWPILLELPAGQQLLINYIANEAKPLPWRKYVLELLMRNASGISRLIQSLENPVFATPIGKLLGKDPGHSLTTARNKLADELNHVFWTALIDSLDPTSMSRISLSEDQVRSNAQSFEQQVFQTSSLDWLRELSGRIEFSTKEEWLAWYEQEMPTPVQHTKLLEYLLETESCPPIILGRVTAPRHLEEISPECLALYKQMLKSKKLEYAAAYALLMYTKDTDAVPVLIDSIAAQTSDNLRDNRAIYLLHNRFAVNFFWDANAWRDWWKNYQESVPRYR